MDDDATLHALFQAVLDDDHDAVRELAARVDVSRAASDRTSALAAAVEDDNVGMAKLLIDLGADVNREADDAESTPLAIALDLMRDRAAWETPGDEMVRLLLDRGADPDLASGHMVPMKMAGAAELKARGIDLTPLLARYRKRS
jgi:ankyrin repeat protein